MIAVWLCAALSDAAAVCQDFDPHNLRIRNKVDPPRSDPVRMGGTAQAEPVYKTEPAFPPEVKSARIYGTVVLTVITNEKGEVYDARVVRGPHPLLNRAALEAVVKWRYRPKVVNGRQVPLLLTVSILFSPKE